MIKAIIINARSYRNFIINSILNPAPKLLLSSKLLVLLSKELLIAEPLVEEAKVEVISKNG